MSIRSQRSLRIRREGVFWLLGAAVLLLVGLLKGINLITLLGCLMLVLWGLNALLAGRRLRRLSGRRRIAGPVFAGVPAAVSLEVTGLGGRGLPAVRLEDSGPEHGLAWFVPRLPAGQTLRFEEPVTLPARGRYAWGAFAAVSGYPFGLLQRRVTLVPGEERIALPRLGRLHRGRLRRFLGPVGLAAERARREVQRHLSARTEFHGLRAFRSGDSPHWIHWRTSARCGELMVREFADVPVHDLIVVLDPSDVRWSIDDSRLKEKQAAAIDNRQSTIDNLEAAVSLAATVCWEWCRQRGDRCVLAVAGHEPVLVDGRTGPEHALRMLECLALVQAGPAPADADDLAERLARLALPGASVLVVGAAPGALADVLGRHLHRPVARVATSALDGVDFYEGPPGPAREGTGHAP
jgi:uncharacterized protein (DUF58 family)